MTLCSCGGVLLLALAVAACGTGAPAAMNPPGDRLAVVATFYPLAEMAERVGGDRVEVTNLTQAGVEPHDLELTSRQVDQLLDAALVVFLAGGFQVAVEEVVATRRGPKVSVLEGKLGEDPHFWLDPTRMVAGAAEVAAALKAADPARAAAYAADEAAYLKVLADLDAEFERGLGMCERHHIVTSHAAFHHLARRYGLTQVPITLSPDSEPDADQVAQLADLIRRQGVTTVFTETLVSPRVAEVLAREAGVKVAVLDPLEGLSDKDLGAGQDYAAVMRRNLAALREALACR